MLRFCGAAFLKPKPLYKCHYLSCQNQDYEREIHPILHPPPLISLPLFQLDELFLRPKKKIFKYSMNLEGGGDVSSEPDEGFAFDRTISRLKEMGGSAYLMKYEQQQQNPS